MRGREEKDSRSNEEENSFPRCSWNPCILSQIHIMGGVFGNPTILANRYADVPLTVMGGQSLREILVSR
jgi:hypothetical protein